MALMNIPDETIPVVSTGNFKGQILEVFLYEVTKRATVIIQIGHKPSGQPFKQIGDRKKIMTFHDTAGDTSYTDFRTALLAGGASAKAYLESRWGDF